MIKGQSHEDDNVRYYFHKKYINLRQSKIKTITRLLLCVYCILEGGLPAAALLNESTVCN